MLMLQVRFRLLVAFTLLALVLAACAGGTTTGGTPGVGDTNGTLAVPGTGSTEAVPGAVGGDTGQCVGVDIDQLTATGQTFYNESCAGCHGQQGEGVGDFPPLAGSENIASGNVAALVESYFAVDAHPKSVTPDQMAGVFNYMGTAFGDTEQVICPEDITIPVQ
jgi:cytochrome c553